MIINNNMQAVNTFNKMGQAQGALSKNMEKLSSGLRINRAGDDAAGLAISEKMRGQIRGLDQANRNAQDGISMIQTAEGALQETHSILQRMRELSVQASNDTNTLTDRTEIQKEVNQLIEEIDRIGDKTSFNTKTLIGDSGSTHTFQIGANAGDSITLAMNSMKSDQIGSTATKLDTLKLDLSTDPTTGGVLDNTSANAAITVINDAIEQVSAERSKFGATQNRLEHTINNLSNASENLQAAESRVRDVDMAKEIMDQTKNNILAQASQAMLAQANQQPQSVLQLLR